MQAAAKAQAEAERRQKEEMNRRRSRLQASMAEVRHFADTASSQAAMFSTMQAPDAPYLPAVLPPIAGCTISLSIHSFPSVICPQAFKEARDAVAEAAAKRAPGTSTAADEKEVARVLRYIFMVASAWPSKLLMDSSHGLT